MIRLNTTKISLSIPKVENLLVNSMANNNELINEINVKLNNNSKKLDGSQDL